MPDSLWHGALAALKSSAPVRAVRPFPLNFFWGAPLATTQALRAARQKVSTATSQSSQSSQSSQPSQPSRSSQPSQPSQHSRSRSQHLYAIKYAQNARTIHIKAAARPFARVSISLIAIDYVKEAIRAHAGVARTPNLA